MAKNNSSNQDFTNESDGGNLGGGATKRFLRWLGANITLTGSGSNTYTFPAGSDTLLGRNSTDTVTGKSMDGDDNTFSDIPASAIKATAWATWSPSWTNLTTTSGTLTYAKYMQIGKTVHYRLRFVFGASSAVTGGVNFTLPVAAHSDYGNTPSDPIGHFIAYDASTALLKAGTVTISTIGDNQGVLRGHQVSGADINADPTDSSTPIPWAVSDVIAISGTYEAA